MLNNLGFIADVEDDFTGMPDKDVELPAGNVR